ncbi:MAG: RluA family pseudouridine synthase [Chloracidobacterium sp.]|nr:RluA family pseudouridine synthase [Chloracidobacterium sp.]MDW8218591.1 RluA family pseudouridine synthase [Acidobacteriota bacterium]
MDNRAALDTDALQVPPAAAGLRLDVFLAERLNVSRSRIQRAIADGEVRVNGRLARASYRVVAGDDIDADIPAPVTTDLQPEDLPLTILFEDEAVIVIDKPAGQVVHPAAGVGGGTLANALAFHFGGRLPGGVAFRPGIVHRLDRDTSGVIVVAKTDAALEHLAGQFRARTVEKRYVALVHGDVVGAGVIDAPIARDRNNRLKMTVDPAGRPARSRYTVLRRLGVVTLLDVQIETGRTHQIRVHCAHIRHPVIGDPLYGQGRDQQLRDAAQRRAVMGLGRQFLHAAQLAFVHPVSGRPMRFTSPLPSDLQACLSVFTGSKHSTEVIEECGDNRRPATP